MVIMILMTFAVPVASQPEAIVAANLGSGKVTIGATGRPVLPVLPASRAFTAAAGYRTSATR